MPAIYVVRIFLGHLIYWMLDEKIGFASWRIKQNDLMTISSRSKGGTVG